MLGGYYSIASGLMTRQREMDVIGNNLINSQTPGYRADQFTISSFEQELLTRKDALGKQAITTGKTATTTVVGAVSPLIGKSGAVKNTDGIFDFAINGEGFFNIQGDNGTNYLTRNGQFDLDNEGNLILPGIGKVLGEGGSPITLETENFTVNTDGTIFAYNNTEDEEDLEGEEVGKLMITAFPEMADLIKEDNGMFRSNNGTGQAAEGFTIAQGSLELSNVDLNTELTSLIEAQRAFQACSSALQTVDSLNRKAAAQLASV